MSIDEYVKENLTLKKEILKIKQDIKNDIKLSGGSVVLPGIIYMLTENPLICFGTYSLGVWVGSNSLYSFLNNLIEKKKLELFQEELFLQTDVSEFFKEVEKQIVVDVARLFDDLKISSLTQIHAAFVFLLKGGYLSFAHHWNYKVLENIHYSYLIAPLLTGGGCCRNIASLLTSIEEQMGLNVCNTLLVSSEIDWNNYLMSALKYSTIFHDLDASFPKCPYLKDLPIKERIKEKKSLLKKLKINYNHLIVSTIENEIVTHFDPTKHCYLENGRTGYLKYYNQNRQMKALSLYPIMIKSGMKNPEKEELYDRYEQSFLECFFKYEKRFQQFYKEHQKKYYEIKKAYDEVLELRKKC